MGGRRKSSGRCSRRMTATRSYTSFGFSKTSSLSVHNQLLPMPRSAEQISRRAEKERERRAAESPASRQARLALAKAATRRRRQAQTLESSITAKRRNSEKKRERRAAESPASRQARLALDKAATRRRRQALESSITAKRLRASHPLRETHLIVQKLKLQSTEWRGACPLSMPGPVNESGHDADLHAKWGKRAMFHASKFIPWDFESPIIDSLILIPKPIRTSRGYGGMDCSHRDSTNASVLSNTSGRRPCNSKLQK